MDLRVARLVQIMHTIAYFSENEDTVRRGEIEWQTKVIASTVVRASAIEDAKYKDQVLEMIQALEFSGAGGAGAPQADTQGSSERSLEDIIERGSVEEALARNNLRKGPGLPFS